MCFQTFFIINLCLVICVQCQSGESGSANFDLSSFDLTEVESVLYDVNIGGMPVLDQALASEVSRNQRAIKIAVMSKHGRTRRKKFVNM